MESPFIKVATEAVGNPAAVLLDVRRDAEWADGHAKGALHWELSRLEAGELPNIPKEADLYTYCAAGGRAGQAATLLRSKGWLNVQNLGGLKDWQAAGGAVE